ncbi:Phenylacetate-coenzyme A ligase PaaK, adenylate-forming domain family [Actinopolymorpha cephalotaxi]|uniref:Phenylacetate-coenzyme A ligase PaaK, adenylate-forming domain family n=1 Tax=Actinopolymorpha cephalotaxi TaxID=504797 RepID=A0A1I2XD81_9ACTN|nr:phenylacetate--CoA ligase family protein [Actinopolymorpha cephalotaxi]NYH86171.1 phenylacetate-coenzyme A ligase PaaK-like adenylate-forming protein [Actinopolymorpha cephalotaxi]SFH11007.1 Phenylacetate-coenzyme A ligase PaaK, adenylate-forming domain family [Actinopolymorpha cephalotaxi]
MAQEDPKAAYERLRAAHLHDVRAALTDHVARLAWPRERIDHYRTERLRSLLGFARERSAFHAARIGDVDPATATVDGLARLPMMVKQDVNAEWDRIVTVPGIDRAGAERVLAEESWFSYTPSGLQVFSSGGSSGVRGVYVWDREQFVTLACLAWRWQTRAEHLASAADGHRQARLAVLEAGEPPHASTPLFDIATLPGMVTFVIPAAAPFDEVLRAVAEVRPTHLVGYASVVGRLARAVVAGALDLRPVRVSTNSEPLGEEDRDAIDTAWGVPVHNLWGSTEIGVQAVGCGQGEGLHICEDEVILERVDASGRPVAPGEPAVRTLATGLAGRAFPFIRYDLGDEVTLLPGRCECGSAMRRVADIAGRRDDDFRYGEQVVPAAAFRHVLGTDPRISEYQVRQTTAGAEVLVVGTPDVGDVLTELGVSLRPYGIPAAAITVHAVEEIPRTAATGKLRRFVPRQR